MKLPARVSAYGCLSEEPRRNDRGLTGSLLDLGGLFVTELKLDDLLQALYFFAPAYAADMSPVFARQLSAVFD